MSEGAPSTSDYVRFHALHQPRAIALIDGAREIDYATFHGDLCRFTRALRELGLPRGASVAVALGDVYLHWLLLLGFENLGVVTASFLPSERDNLPQLFACVQLVVAESELPQAAGAKGHRLTREWLEAVRSSPALDAAEGEAVAPLRLDEPQRIRRSSGTTGSPKLMVTTRGYDEVRLHTHLCNLGFTPHTRYLISTPFTVGILYAHSTLCLRLGGTCICAGRDLAKSFLRHRLTHARLFQFQVEALLEGLPADFPKPDDLTVIMSSAPVSRSLWEKIMARLASRIAYFYSTNEVGPIATIGEDGAGTVRPGVEVEVVDERGVPVPAGQAGEIRVRAPYIVDRYLGDADASARMFRGGWFHPGDSGMLLPSGQLKLVGRVDELLNIGGLKVAPAVIEATISKAVQVADIGVSSVRNEDGIEEICVALVLAGGTSLKEMGARIRQCLPPGYGRVRFRATGSIPRTAETGKVRRGELKKLFQGS